MRYAAKWPEYARQWDAMTINPERVGEFETDARRIISHKEQYQAIEHATYDGPRAVPWWLIAIIHLREASLDFRAYLGNGQPLSQKTTEVPAGRGPFTGPDAFENGALDALRIDGLTGVLDWRLEKALYYQELFNGAGYNNRGLPSPYIWGGTNIQRPGKYTSDRRFNARVWDTQPGCAPMIATLARLDPSIILVRET